MDARGGQMNMHVSREPASARRVRWLTLVVALLGAMVAAVPPADASVTLRGTSQDSGNRTHFELDVPAGTGSADGWILFVSANKSGVSIGTPTGGGWDLLDQVVDGSMQTSVWQRHGSAPSVPTIGFDLSSRAKVTAQLLVYADTAEPPVAAWAAQRQPSQKTTFTTPSLSGIDADSTVVSHWSTKLSITTDLAAPSGVTVRAETANAGSGRLSTVTADDVDGGTVGDLTATGGASGKATMWTIAVADGDSNPPPPPASTIRWDMEEPEGSTLMLPVTPGHPVGNIGSEVRLDRHVNGAIGYGFQWRKPNTPPAVPEHLVRVPDSDALDPDTATYTFSIRYRTTASFGNLIQKGQSRAYGGMFKIQLPGGRIQCLFRDRDRVKGGVGTQETFNDGEWHVITCQRSADRVRLWVDGVLQGQKMGVVGEIDNDWELTIGGKPQCDQIEVTCDYFTGTVDYVEITKE